jgi:hypothetical protein
MEMYLRPGESRFIGYMRSVGQSVYYDSEICTLPGWWELGYCVKDLYKKVCLLSLQLIYTEWILIFLTYSQQLRYPYH